MDYKKFDDQTLLRLIVRADENALGELYDRFGRLVYSIALNSIGNPALAEEVTQDVFFRVWKNAASYRPEQSKVITWMTGITRNRAIDEIRRLNVRPEANQVPWENEEAEFQEEAMDVEAYVELSQRQIRVRKAVAQLPEEQRQALAYAFFQGYSHSEIAELLNEPLGTIKTRIRLAMRKLRDILGDENLLGDKSKSASHPYI